MAGALDIVSVALLAAPGVAALVGRRVYPVMAPQGAELPNIAITLVSDNDDMLLSGAAQFPESRVSVVSRGLTATQMLNLADAVKVALRNITHQPVGDALDVCIHKSGTDFTAVFDDPLSFEQTTDYMVRWRE